MALRIGDQKRKRQKITLGFLNLGQNVGGAFWFTEIAAACKLQP